jgi:hypothetical protein
MRQINSVVVVVASALLSIAGLARAEGLDQSLRGSNDVAHQASEQPGILVAAETDKKTDPAPSPDVQERAIPRPPIGAPPGGVIVSPRPRGPVAASTDVSCSNGKKFSISTGSKQGRCDVHIINGKVTGGQCNDGNGNDAYVSCDVGCKGSSGAGDCKDNSPK